MPTSLVRLRPVLPVSLRLTLGQRFDPDFTVILALVFLSHLGFVLYLRGVDWPRRPSIEDVPDRVVRTVLRRVQVPIMPSVASSLPKTPATRSPRRVVRDVPQIDRRVAIATQMRRTGLVAVLTSMGDNGQLADLLSAGGSDRDQAAALREIGGLSVPGDSAGLRTLIGGPVAQGRISRITDLRGMTSIEGPTVLSGPVERKVVTVIRHDPPVLDGAGDPATFSREVNAHLSALRVCYERALRRDASLAGRVVLRFTVTAAGTVADVSIDEASIADPAFRDCLMKAVSHWRFTAPSKGAIEISFPFIFQSGQ